MERPERMSTIKEYESFGRRISSDEHTPLLEIMSSHNSYSSRKRSNYNWRAVIAVLMLVVVVLVLLLSAPMSGISNLSPADTLTSNGLRVNFRYLSSNHSISERARYVKVNLPHDQLVLGETFPTYQSTTFELVAQDEGTCYKLKSLTGKWVTIQKDGTLAADERRVFYATSFESYFVDDHNRKILKLKVCEKLKFVTIADDAASLQSVSPKASPLYIDPAVRTVTDASVGGSLLEIEVVNQFRGVNLGGWFIPEVWMLGSFFEGTGQGWGSSLCAMMNYSVSVTEARMHSHLRSWITEEDFRQMRDIGFNSVRLPIGYWNIIDDPYERYAPRNLSVSLHYIDWAFDMASKYGLSVMLDLHGMPGSQNGQDHSGCSYSIVGQPQWTTPHNVALSLQAVDALASRYSARTNLMGIELMNEPSQRMCQTNHTIMRRYYEDAYRIIRRYSDSVMVIFNELYEDCYDVWDEVMREPEYYNVMVDFHLYDWQGPYNSETRNQHIQHARSWAALIEHYSEFHPILVGEWCMSTGTKIQAGQEFVNTAVESFQRSAGWWLWNWKVEHTLGFYEWDVQYQFQVNGPNGLNALQYFNLVPPTSPY